MVETTCKSSTQSVSHLPITKIISYENPDCSFYFVPLHWIDPHIFILSGTWTNEGWHLASLCANATVVKAMSLASTENFSLTNGLAIVMVDTGPNKLVALWFAVPRQSHAHRSVHTCMKKAKEYKYIINYVTYLYHNKKEPRMDLSFSSAIGIHTVPQQFTPIKYMWIQTLQ
jgi:hypothetical protein